MVARYEYDFTVREVANALEYEEFRDLRDEAYKLEDELEPRVDYRVLTDDEERDLTYEEDLRRSSKEDETLNEYEVY